MDNLASLLDKYKNNRVIRGLIQLIPLGFGSAADVVLISTLEKIQKDRATTFFDELAKGNAVIDEKLLESEDFLHAFFITTKYALNTRRKEKIRMFARLLKNSLNENPTIDEYEELSMILDELHYRELIALKFLDEYTSTHQNEDKEDYEWTQLFWNDFVNQLHEELNIPSNEICDFMNRITRTGCYGTFTMWIDYKGGEGKLTHIFYRLKSFIEDVDKQK